MTFSFWKSWIWLLLSKKNTFYCTLNLTQFSNFTVTLTLSCYQTWWDGLDLTCPSFRGLNFDDFPFFWTFERTSGSRDRPILRFIGNWWHFRNIKDGAVQCNAIEEEADDDHDDWNKIQIIVIIIIISSSSSSYPPPPPPPHHHIIIIWWGWRFCRWQLHCTIFDISEMSPISYKS